jgi:CMP-2-keto-3-deoxyoctulosonic acid synthetase
VVPTLGQIYNQVQQKLKTVHPDTYAFALMRSNTSRVDRIVNDVLSRKLDVIINLNGDIPCPRLCPIRRFHVQEFADSVVPLVGPSRLHDSEG